MALRKVLIWPDPRLREVAQSVGQIDDMVRTLAQDLLDTMHDKENPGAGLAATQLGVPKRVFTVDMPSERGSGEFESTDGPLVCINPEFTRKEGNVCFEEACLSVPKESGPVERAAYVVMQYTDLKGKQHQLQGKGILAVCLQHEYDHLDGKLWIDYQSRFKRETVRRRMLKLKRAQEQRQA